MANSNSSILVEITPNLRHHLLKFFKEQGSSVVEAEAKFRVREEWYGIVTGIHIHKVLSELGLEDEE